MTSKIYSAKHNGKEDFFIVAKTNCFRNNTCYSRVGFVEHILESDLTDLTELEFHPKGTGVWVEGVTIKELIDLLHFADEKLVWDGTRNPFDIKQTLNSVFAQLSQPTEEASDDWGEDVPLKDVWFCKKCYVKFFTVRTAAEHDCSPAKVSVTIELSEEDALEARFHDEDLASSRIGEQICNQVAERLRELNPIPTPMEEPKVGCAVILRGGELFGVGFAKHSIETHIQEKGWGLTGSSDFWSWKELLNIDPNPEVIYSPTRIGGGEK